MSKQNAIDFLFPQSCIQKASQHQTNFQSQANVSIKVIPAVDRTKLKYEMLEKYLLAY